MTIQAQKTEKQSYSFVRGKLNTWGQVRDVILQDVFITRQTGTEITQVKYKNK